MASNYRGFSDRLKGLSSGKEEEEKRVSSSSSNPQQKQSGQYKSFSERVGSTAGNTNTVSSAISRAVGSGKMTPFEAAATILQYGNYAKAKEESEKTEPTYRNLDEPLELGSDTPLSRLSRPFYADTVELPEWAKEKTGQMETPQVETPVVSSDVSFVDKSSASKERKAEIRKLNREINGETFERDLLSVPFGAVIGDEKKKKAYISAKEKTIAQKRERYNQLVEEEQNANLYDGLERESDFAELSKPTKDMSASSWKDKADFLYGFINGKEGFSDFENMHGWDDEFAEGTYKFMLPDEKHKFNYLYNKYGGEYAVEYADSLIDELNRRRGMDRAIETDTLLEKLGLAVGQTTEGWGTSAKQIWENVAGSGDAVPLAPSQYAYQKVRSEEENWLTGAAMDLTSAGVDMLPMIAVSYATAGLGTAVGLGAKAATTVGQIAGNATMFGNVYGRSYNQKLREGYSKDQANTYALIIACLEGGLSYALSGVSALGGGGWKVLSKAGSKVVGKPAAAIAKLTGVDKAVSRLATSKVGQVFGKAASSTAGRFIGKSIVTGNKEGIEEGLQEILEPIVSSMVFNEKYKGADIGDVAYAYLLGAVLGGGFESTVNYSQARYESATKKSGEAIVNNALRKKAEELGISVEELDAATKQEVEESIVKDIIKEGLASEEGSAPYQVAKNLQTKLDNGQKISAFELGNLYATEVQDVRAKITEAMEKADAENAPITKDFGTYGKSAFRDLRNQFPNVPVEELAESFNTAYQVGREGTEMNKVEFVNQAQVDAYNAGRLDATVAELPAEKGYATVYGKESGFIDTNPNDGIDKALKDNLNPLGKALGVKIMMVDTIKGKNGKGANAEYSNGIVRIARDSDKPFIVAAKHEITHHLEKAAPKQYKAFANHALEIVSARDGVVASHIIEGYLEQGYSESEAYHEVAADFTEYILTDESALTEFVEESAKSEEKRSVVQAFFDAIHNFVAKIKKAFGGNIEQTNDATVRAFGATVEQLEKAERLWKEALKAAKEYAESNPEGFNAKDNKTDFNFKGINKYGIEVYETSEAILRLPWKERKKRFREMMENEYEGRTAKLIRNGHAYYARLEKVDIRKNIYGDKSSDDVGRDAKINTGADGEFFTLVENMKYSNSKPERGKKGTAHKDVLYWDYFIKSVQIDGRVYDLRAHVRKRADGEFVYLIGLKENKTKKAAPPENLQQADGLNGAQATFNSRVPQPKPNVKQNLSQNPEEDVRNSTKGESLADKVNRSMTMAQAKDMVQRAFVIGEIKEWYDGKYLNGDEWLKGEGAEDVAMIIDNEWSLHEKYLNKVQGVLDGDFYAEDILKAYLEGTLTGTQKKATERLDTSNGYDGVDNRFFAPHQVEEAKARYDVATQKATSKNREEVYKARADIIMFAHTKGAAEVLGISQTELNKKLSQWARYTARAREVSERFNAGVADWNKWTGIENSNILNRATVNESDLEGLVGEVVGDSSGYQRKYIIRTMLALDTHIDYSGLNFEFVGNPKSNGQSVSGLYGDSQRKIVVKRDAPHTVAHEMGHYLDYQWARDVGVSGALTDGLSRGKSFDAETKQWIENFDSFKDKITDVADIRSGYSMDSKEVFARFVDKFVRWVNNIANPNGDFGQFHIDYNDRFTNQHYAEFVRLLQEKSLLDGKKAQEDIRFSQKGDNVLAEVNKLRQVNAALKEQFKRTKFAKVDKKSLDAFAKKLLKDYSSEADINETRDALDDLYTYMANGEGKNQPVWEEVWKRAQKVAESVLEGAVVVDDSLYQEYKDLRDTIRKTGITIDPMYDNSLPGYESINEFRKSNFGRIRLVNNGVSVDSFYQELADMYPQFFDSDAHMTEPDQLVHIAEVLDNLRPIEFNPHTRDMRESINWLADDIIERFYELPQANPTFADKQHQKLVRKMIESGHKREEAVAKERAKREKAVEKVKEHYKAKEARTKERRSASTYKEKIKKHVSTISKMLIKGNDKSHVPEVMRSVVGDFLSVLDLTTPRQLEVTKDRLNELRNLYTKIAEGKTEIDVEVDPDFFAYVDTVLNGLKHGGDSVSISDLNVDELESLYRVVLAVERSIYMHNRIMTEGKSAEISELARMVMAELKTDKAFVDKANRIARFASDTINMDMLNPQDFFIQLGGTMNGLFQSIRDGFDKKIRHLAEAKEYMNRLTKGVDINELSGKNAVAKEFELQGGKKIKLTPAQVMSLYLLQKQPDATRHIYEGGIKAAPVVAREGKNKRARVVQDYEVVRVTPEDVSAIIGSMSAEQKKIADGIGKFFTDFTANWGNEVSLALYGYKKFTVDNYFPIVSDKNYLNDVFGETTDATLKNMGSTKARIEGANNPIVIEDAFDVFSRQADTMSSYNAFVIPLSDIQRVYNAKSLNGSVKQSIEKRYGARATNYFKKLMVDINGGARWNGGSQLMNTLISKYKQSKMGLNLRVILQQPSAFVRAMAVINPKYLAEAMTHKSSADMETIYKYAPIVQWKNWGYFSMDTGKQMKEVLLGQKDLSDVTMWAAGKMDELTWKRLWAATEMETQDKRKDLKVGSEEYYTEVGKRFSEIIDRTQVVDSVLHRSQLMRNPDTLVRMSASFMNEPFKAYNMVRTAVTEFRRNPSEATKHALVGATVGYISSIVINHLITALVDNYRGDDEDEEWLEKVIMGDKSGEPKTWQQRYWWHFADNLVNEPLSMFPYLKDVFSMLQGYDVKRMDMQGIGDFLNAAKRASSDKFTPMQKVLDVGSKFADLFGVPLSNVKREVESLTKLVLAASGSPMMEYQIAKTMYDIPANKSKYIKILYESQLDGDQEVYNTIRRELINAGISPSDIANGIKSLQRKKIDSLGKAQEGGKADDINKMRGELIAEGVSPSEIEERLKTLNTFKPEDLTKKKRKEYNANVDQMTERIIGDYNSMGFSEVDGESADKLMSAAYRFVEDTALESASEGKYDSETDWINEAQKSVDGGMSYTDAILLHKFKYDPDAPVSIATFMDFKDRLGDLEPGVDYEKDTNGARKKAVIELLNSMHLPKEEFDYLLGTVYKSTSKGFGSCGFGSGSGFGSR